MSEPKPGLIIGWLDAISLWFLLIVAVPLFVAPWPLKSSHLLEAYEAMLLSEAFGAKRWLDVFMHGFPMLIVFAKVGRLAQVANQSAPVKKEDGQVRAELEALIEDDDEA